MVSRASAADWTRPLTHRPAVDVLIPTADRPAELAVTLAGLAAQDDPAFRVVISDQSQAPVEQVPAVEAMVRVLRAQGRPVDIVRHLPHRGMAEQRQYLFEYTAAPACLYLDDDVWLEPGALTVMQSALDELDCGFVGMAVQGLSHLDDRRPDEWHTFEPWAGPVTPEKMSRSAAGHERWMLHNAANLTHIAAQVALPEKGWLPYRVAWIGGCVLYRRAALAAAGAFSFWTTLPADHVGEDVVAQWAVMRRRGGAGILPSGAVHLEAPTTLPERSLDAPDAVLDG
ncbi:glycosyltransferase family A protein [Microbacterium horticulturae]|uniref:Glycosyltransferase family A protein n=1 Tax=Microbacterium horticulturae TaxID=3028316 RepID=A0ABY8BZ49_9MICO|nr:glycosyltransferase family A protein [Microbacterium sp. KACC 23027]WEG09486.1 glycosyltransferase family A protein [Microbacterium sp. KACC 23027]